TTSWKSPAPATKPPPPYAKPSPGATAPAHSRPAAHRPLGATSTTTPPGPTAPPTPRICTICADDTTGSKHTACDQPEQPPRAFASSVTFCYIDGYPARMRRDHWQRRIAELDPDTDYERISRLVSQYEFSWDIMQALSFALFRTYAVPSIGKLLYETGEFTTDTQRRHDDTVLILEHISVHGMETDPGRSAIRRMNQMHGRYNITNDEMLYVLATFVVTPVRWVQQYGKRALTEAEIRAGVHTCRRLGALMGIHDIPHTFADFAAFM